MPGVLSRSISTFAACTLLSRPFFCVLCILLSSHPVPYILSLFRPFPVSNYGSTCSIPVHIFRFILLYLLFHPVPSRFVVWSTFPSAIRDISIYGLKNDGRSSSTSWCMQKECLFCVHSWVRVPNALLCSFGDLSPSRTRASTNHSTCVRLRYGRKARPVGFDDPAADVCDHDCCRWVNYGAPCLLVPAGDAYSSVA